MVFPGRAPLRFPSALRFPGPLDCCCVARLPLPWVLELICGPAVLPVSFLLDLGNRKSPLFGMCDLGSRGLPSFGVCDHRSPFLVDLVRPGAWPLAQQRKCVRPLWCRWHIWTMRVSPLRGYVGYGVYDQPQVGNKPCPGGVIEIQVSYIRRVSAQKQGKSRKNEPF